MTNDLVEVSVILLTFNQECYAAEALSSILAQECSSSLEIIVSDDSSTDQTCEVLNNVIATYDGAHSVYLFRNAENLGLAENFNRAVARAKGEIICMAAGDDLSLPDRVARTVSAFRSYPQVSIVAFNDHQIDESGCVIHIGGREAASNNRVLTLTKYLERTSKHLSGASRGFRRELFEKFGNLSINCPTEDTPYLLRGLMLGEGLVLPEAGIYYRRHQGNLSGALSLQNMDIQAIFNQYREDAGLAQRRGIVSPDEYSQIQAWIELKFVDRSIKPRFRASQSKIRFFLMEVILSSKLSAQQKIHFIKAIGLYAKRRLSSWV